MSKNVRFKTIPFECHVRVHYDNDGELTRVEVAVNGRVPIVRHAEEPGETPGELFDHAFEAAKVLLVTQQEVPEGSLTSKS